MAIVHSRPVKGIHERSEVKTFEALSLLDDSWHVFHSIQWIGLREGRTGDGEADFVLLNARHGAVVLEVKGGGIEVEAGRWHSNGASGRYGIKDPYRQATASKVVLHKWLGKSHGVSVPTAHGVVFPDFSDLGSLGAHAPPEVTLTQRDLSDVEGALGRLVRFWKIEANLTAKQIKTVSAALTPKTRARRTLADEAFDAHHGLVTLTLEQIRAFSGISRNRRAVVFGGAGTGKTILAMEKAADFEAQGGEILVLCYNKLLGKRLREDPRLRRSTVATFHSFCATEARKAGLSLPDRPDRDFWERGAAELLVESLSITGRRFDAVVVDEGQDFSKEWMDALELVGAHDVDTPFYIFADEDQRLWPRSWEPDPAWFVYELSLNCRNTEQIASRVGPIRADSRATLGAKGPDAKWVATAKGERPAVPATRAVERLLREGFSPREICVLCENSRTANELLDGTVADHAFGPHGTKGIAVETIARFKGMESPAVVVVLESEGLVPDVDAYVGFSRASTYLEVVGPPARMRALSWT